MYTKAKTTTHIYFRKRKKSWSLSFQTVQFSCVEIKDSQGAQTILPVKIPITLNIKSLSKIIFFEKSLSVHMSVRPSRPFTKKSLKQKLQTFLRHPVSLNSIFSKQDFGDQDKMGNLWVIVDDN